MKKIQIYGCNYFIKFNQNLDPLIQMEQIIYKYKINYVIFPKSNLSYQYAGCLSVKTKFSIINNIVSVPVNEKNNLKLKKNKINNINNFI